MNSAPGAGEEEMVAAAKKPSPPGPEEAAAGEAVAAHIIILATAAAARRLVPAGKHARALTGSANDDGWSGGLGRPQQGHYKDSDLLRRRRLLRLLPAPPSPLLGPLI